MHTLNHLVTQAREQEIARAANHPSRLMSHDLRLARRNTRRRRDPATSARERSAAPPVTARAGDALSVLAALAVGLGLWLAYRGRSVLVASSVGLASYVVLAAGIAALP